MGFESPRLHPASLKLCRMPCEALAKQGFYYTISRMVDVKYVYLLESLKVSGQRYVGTTSDLNKRLKEHNSGKSAHTNKFKPWKIVVAVRFEDDHKADNFERYLKSGSGYAFANRHF